MTGEAEVGQPDIGDYAFIGDCHTGALISRHGSIDWCCLPRLDDDSVFGRLLDPSRGGHCTIRPRAAGASVARRYLDDTMVMETTWRTGDGDVRVLDLFTMREGGRTAPYRQLLRVVDGVAGEVVLGVHVEPRFGYGAVTPWLRRHGPGLWSAVGGDAALVVAGDVPFDAAEGRALDATVTVGAGERVRLSLVAERPERLDPGPPEAPDGAELDRRVDETIGWWRSWAGETAGPDPVAAGARRSALVLKSLVNAPTGAMAAAATTSLPEVIGGERNWDYRLCWIRDSQFSVRSLAELGHTEEADGLRRFVERCAAGDAAEVQIAFGLGGERRLTEHVLPLAGYRDSAPVRVGNSAAHQLQLDVYGELLDLAWRWHRRGRSPDDDYWRFLVGLVDLAAERWREPDRGLWEMRHEPRHFVHSKAMCWVALDRGLRLAAECTREVPAARWRRIRDEVGESVRRQGVDPERGCFVQAFGSRELDAALLLLPAAGFVAVDDPVMVATVAAVVEDLEEGGLLRRYRGDDGLAGEEGAFVACTFWLAECLAGQGDLAGARRAFDRAVATANDLGLFSEEFDVTQGRALGNCPQALTHLSHISAAVELVRTARRRR